MTKEDWHVFVNAYAAVVDKAIDGGEFVVPSITWKFKETGLALPTTQEDQEGFLAVAQQIPSYTFFTQEDWEMSVCTMKLGRHITVTDPDAFLQRVVKANKGWPKVDREGTPLKPFKLIEWIVTNNVCGENQLRFLAHPFIANHIEVVDKGTVLTSAGNIVFTVEPNVKRVP